MIETCAQYFPTKKLRKYYDLDGLTFDLDEVEEVDWDIFPADVKEYTFVVCYAKEKAGRVKVKSLVHGEIKMRGNVYLFYKGRLYSEKGKFAIVREDVKEHYSDWKLHNWAGPARINKYGVVSRFCNGKLHSEGPAAATNKCSDAEYYINGCLDTNRDNYISKGRRIRIVDDIVTYKFCAGETVEICGKLLDNDEDNFYYFPHIGHFLVEQGRIQKVFKYFPPCPLEGVLAPAGRVLKFKPLKTIKLPGKHARGDL